MIGNTHPKNLKFCLFGKMMILFPLLVSLAFLFAGCESNETEPTILDYEIKFRGYEWFFSDDDEILWNDLKKAYSSMYVGINLDHLRADTASLSIYRDELYTPSSVPYEKKPFIEGRALRNIYVDYILDKRTDIKKLVSGAYIFDGYQSTFDHFLQVLTEKYGKPDRKKTRNYYGQDIIGYEFKDSDIGACFGKSDYYEWHGQNSTVLELSFYKSNGRGWSDVVCIRYYIQDGYKEFNEQRIESQREEWEKKKLEEEKMNNNAL